MSILMEVLEEEFDRLERQEIAYKRDLDEIPKGYISKKKINGKEYYYLQYKKNGKVMSEYISLNNLSFVEAQVKRRRYLEESLRRVKEDKRKLRKVLG